MKVLVHACCGPCLIFPLSRLRERGDTVMGYFYGHNIHPYTEMKRRMDTLAEFAGNMDLRVVYQDGYDLEGFLRGVAFREADRCRFCYHERLKAAAMVAKKGKFEAFTTTLLYSRFQKHDLIRSVGEAVAAETGVRFHYEDFRNGWKEGIAESKRLGMYRQPYCGCIYSEKERYYPGNRRPVNRAAPSPDLGF